MCYRLRRVIIERVGRDEAVTIVEFHIIIEHSLARTGVILSPVGHQVVFSVDQLSTLHEISRLVQSVVGEAVGIERLLAMLQHHIPARHHQFLGTVVGAHVAIQRERVALLETHVAKGLHRVRSLVIVGAVAPQMSPLVNEMHAAFCNLCVARRTIEVVSQLVGMLQIDLVVFHLRPLPFHRRHGANQTKSEKAQNQHHESSMPIRERSILR